MAKKTKSEAENTRKKIIEAARGVFLERGVIRATFENIAKAAGVTRGAIYWHFSNKAELFFAMREDAFTPLIERTDAALYASSYDNPLDAIGSSLTEFFGVIQESATVRAVFEIMMSRCEYVDEFACVQEELDRPALNFLAKIEQIYQLALEKKTLHPRISPHDAARDTWVFTVGLLNLVLVPRRNIDIASDLAHMIESHMELKRA
ncbi:TetR family transcriptional regulator [Ferribacterium limneticum]|uniref:TetR family transcriptional regulator n=1 Tax=Ferribacterium limneticum TaxID=76259 RepID=UPI001CF94585|nr:TetR family transcriptional regulator [Ferribacterium limneticum]UCV17756.1 TetR family transcriptional regulator [Ferribacterium limneticum]